MIIYRDCNTCKNALKAIYHFFYLAKLDSKSAQLDLIVHSSEKLYFIIGINFCKIACFICTFSIQFNKCSGSFLRQIHISSADSKTCYNKLTGFSVRQDMILFIDNKYLHISIWSTDCNFLTVCDYLHRTTYCCLCRTIPVHNISILIYQTNLFIKCRWKCFCSDIKNLNLGHCLFELWQINDV